MSAAGDKFVRHDAGTPKFFCKNKDNSAVIRKENQLPVASNSSCIKRTNLVSEIAKSQLPLTQLTRVRMAQDYLCQSVFLQSTGTRRLPKQHNAVVMQPTSQYHGHCCRVGSAISFTNEPSVDRIISYQLSPSNLVFILSIPLLIKIWTIKLLRRLFYHFSLVSSAANPAQCRISSYLDK